MSCSNFSSDIVAQKLFVCAWRMSCSSIATMFTLKGSSPISSIILSFRVSNLSFSSFKFANETSTISFSNLIALKSTSATVLNNGFTTPFKNSILPCVRLFQKFSSSNLCNSNFASIITTEFRGRVSTCFLSCSISFSTICVLDCVNASSTFSRRTPNKRTGKGI